MILRAFLRFGPGTLSAGILAFAGAAAAQTASGQFTPDSQAPIQLHMPVHLHPPVQHHAPARRANRPVQAASSTPTAEASSVGFGPTAPVQTPPQKAAAMPAAKSIAAKQPSRSERRKAVQEVLSGPANAMAVSESAIDVSAPSGAIPFSFDSTAPPPSKPKPAAAPKRSAAPPLHPEPQLASREQPPAQTPVPKPPADPHAGLTKKGEVLFSGTDIDPKPDSADSLKAMAANLNSAMDSGAARIELEAFGGAPGDKSSDARRLSLRRGLAIRQLLIDSGLPANRIDVKALGGANDHGDADRVDVYLRGAS